MNENENTWNKHYCNEKNDASKNQQNPKNILSIWFLLELEECIKSQYQET